MNITIWRIIAGGLRSLVLQPPVGTGGTVSLAIAIQSACGTIVHGLSIAYRIRHIA